MRTPNGYFRRDHQELLLGGSCRFAMTPIVYCCKACPHNEWWWWLRALRWHAHTAKCGEAQEPQMHQTGQGELSKNCILGCFILGPWQRPHSFGGPNGWFELAIPFHLLVDHEFPHWLAASIELGYTNVVTLDGLTGLHTWFVTSRRSRNHGALLLTWIGRLDALGVKGKTSTEDWEYREYGGFHSHGGTPIAGWFITENPKQKWMI